jgi:uracil-DNA glycosylase family 4
MGFFATSELADKRKPLSMVAQCGQCGFYKSCVSPKFPVFGKGKRRILFVGEYPTKEEDQAKSLLSNADNQWLIRTLNKLGLDFERDCWFTNALICKPNKFNPETKYLDFCKPNLINTIKELDPISIVPMGQSAITSLIGYCWKEGPGHIDNWLGWNIPSQKLNAWIHPTWSAASIVKMNNQVQDLFFRKHILKALEYTKRPWNTIPDYKSEVEILTDPIAVRMALRRFAKQGNPIAYDYETNMLKPDSDDAKIVCCSVSDGKRTIVFPWRNAIAAVFKDLMLSDVPKIASNIKFEMRWTKKFVGVWIKNRLNRNHDTMLAAHVLDNRPSITSIKFQSFVLLGQPEYNAQVDKFLKTHDGGGYTMNRINQCDMRDLLLYCGLDSLLEMKVYQKQLKSIARDEN